MNAPFSDDCEKVKKEYHDSYVKLTSFKYQNDYDDYLPEYNKHYRRYEKCIYDYAFGRIHTHADVGRNTLINYHKLEDKFIRLS